jgi:hypothetical protein
VDERGNVIGVVVAKLNQRAALATSGALAENVNYAVKSSYLLKLTRIRPRSRRQAEGRPHEGAQVRGRGEVRGAGHRAGAGALRRDFRQANGGRRMKKALFVCPHTSYWNSPVKGSGF